MRTGAAATTDARLVIGPNASLSLRQARWFFGWMAFVAFAVAGFFALHGFWPVLPFAGLEILALAVVLVICLRRNRYREVVCFAGDRIRVEFGAVGQGAVSVVTLPRSSTRAVLDTGPYRNSPSRLLLCYGEQRLEVGNCLTDEERATLCRRLRQLIHPGWERPGAVVEETVGEHVWR